MMKRALLYRSTFLRSVDGRFHSERTRNLASQTSYFSSHASSHDEFKDDDEARRSTDHQPTSPGLRVRRTPVVAFPQSNRKTVPATIARPPYAATGVVPHSTPDQILLHDVASARRMRTAARVAREALDFACSLASVGVTTDAIDNAVHEALLSRGVYPSPLNYAGFPKSLCSSVNEVICHGIPDLRPLEFGDVVSFDVSCYVHFPEDGIGVHGDNCATVIVGDAQDVDEIGVDWRGVPYRSQFDTTSDQAHFEEARRLVAATREALYAGIDACKPGGCLTDIGGAIEDVADREGYSSVRKYLGHGIGSEFHCDPFVRHYRNDHKLGECTAKQYEPSVTSLQFCQ